MRQTDLLKILNAQEVFEVNCEDINCRGTCAQIYHDVLNKIRYTRCTRCWNIKVEAVIDAQ